MWGVEQAFRAHVLATTAVTGLIGERFYMHYAPQNRPEGAATPAPYCVCWIVSENTDQLLDGPGSFGNARLQVDVYAKGVESARDVSEAIRLQCDGWHGEVAGADSTGTARALEFYNVRLVDTNTSYESSDDEAGWDVVSCDYVVTYPQTVPGYVGR